MKIQVYLTLAVMTLTSVAHAAVIYSENFDSLSAGALVGQGGWTLNNAGTSNVVNDASKAYSAPNYMTLGGSGAVQHTFTATSLSTESTNLSFYFLSTATAAGHNIQLSLRAAASGNASVFYLNLLGAGTGLQAGISSSSFSSYTFSSALTLNSYYLFSATTDPLTSQMTFSVTPAAGGSALTSGTIDLSSTLLTTQRIVLSSNSSTVAGEWAIDNISFATVPEPSTVTLFLAGMVLAVIRMRHSALKMRNR